jgi:hypothetical protein
MRLRLRWVRRHEVDLRVALLRRDAATAAGAVCASVPDSEHLGRVRGGLRLDCRAGGEEVRFPSPRSCDVVIPHEEAALHRC